MSLTKVNKNNIALENVEEEIFCDEKEKFYILDHQAIFTGPIDSLKDLKDYLKNVRKIKEV